MTSKAFTVCEQKNGKIGPFRDVGYLFRCESGPILSIFCFNDEKLGLTASINIKFVYGKCNG